FFGMFFVIACVFAAATALTKNRSYRVAKRTYNRQRRGLLREPKLAMELDQLQIIPTPEEYLAKLEQLEST
ncbi:MAG: hypothetical protein AB8G99_07110, partial [Planctomycetaceae bacterium]